jgi:hypothetical protein
MKPLSEAELKGTRELADKIKKATEDARTAKKAPSETQQLQQIYLLHHLEEGLLDPLYPAKVRAALAIAEELFDQSVNPRPPRPAAALSSATRNSKSTWSMCRPA